MRDVGADPPELPPPRGGAARSDAAMQHEAACTYRKII